MVNIKSDNSLPQFCELIHKNEMQIAALIQKRFLKPNKIQV